ncbi:MAG: ketopantoate reductase C-terminal domain-containing protein, partial [Pseudomonadota bacterium]
SAACATEALEVARAKGIAVDVEDARTYTYNFGMKIPHSRPSLAQDHDAGKIGEIDAINGAIPREGKPLGIATPVNAAVTQIIKAREALF